MTSENKRAAPDADRLRELAYLSSAVGHHVINGFSAAVSNAELIRLPASAHLSHSELAALGDAIIEMSLDASQVARRLIDWARRETAIEVEEPGREPQAVDLNQLIREVVESEKTSCGAQVDWLLDLDSIPSIQGDPVALRAMFGYLVENAREALPQDSGTVAISARSDPRSWVIITIKDSGRGMSPEVLKRAAEPFYTTKPDRSGIGLTIAHGTWRRHFGTFAIESSPGKGTSIRLSVGPVPPAQPVDPGADSAQPAERPPPPSPTVTNPPSP
jgi:signal transduction histidine kinase